MINLLTTFLLIAIGTALVTYVVTRAGRYLPAQLFVAVVAILVWLPINGRFRDETQTAAGYYALTAANIVLLALFSLVLLALLSRLFVPEWWRGARPVRWILMPYALVILFLVIDLAGRTRLIFQGVESSQSRRFELDIAQPAGGILPMLFVAGWLVHLGVLVSAFVRYPRQRVTVGLLFAALLASSVVGLFTNRVSWLVPLQSLFNAVPLMVALAYGVLRTRLVVPTQAAFDLAVAALNDAIVVLDTADQVVHVNPAAARLGLAAGQPLAAALEQAGAPPDAGALLAGATGRAAPARLTLAGRRLVVESVPVNDRRGQQVGRLLLGRDITDLELRTAQLEAEGARLATLVSQLEAEQRERAQLVETVRGLTMPVIPVLPGVLVAPLVGELDARRAADLSTVMLTAIERERAHLVLLDVTGLPLLDTAGAAAITRAVKAVALLGARCVLVGIQPEVAQALVALGMDLRDVATSATLQQAIEAEIRQAGPALRRNGGITHAGR